MVSMFPCRLFLPLPHSQLLVSLFPSPPSCDPLPPHLPLSLRQLGARPSWLCICSLPTAVKYQECLFLSRWATRSCWECSVSLLPTPRIYVACLRFPWSSLPAHNPLPCRTYAHGCAGYLVCTSDLGCTIAAPPGVAPSRAHGYDISTSPSIMPNVGASPHTTFAVQ